MDSYPSAVFPVNWHKVEWNDHEFAAFLRKHGAIDYWTQLPRHTIWFRHPRTKPNQPVAKIEYHGHTFHTKYINEELKDDRTPGHE